MPTSFVRLQANFLPFAVGLCSAARVCTSAQLGRHPEMSGRSQPARRAKEFLAEHPETFERVRGIYPYAWLWRLTREFKRERGLSYRNVGASQRTGHWLAFGDLWMQLVFHGMRPSKWYTEGRKIGGFDIFAEIHGKPYLIEMQLSPLSERDWKQKWYRRGEWLETKPWMNPSWAAEFCAGAPSILLVTKNKMRVTLPRAGVTYIPSIEQVRYKLKPSP